jgi:hypothetical protein
MRMRQCSCRNSQKEDSCSCRKKQLTRRHSGDWAKSDLPCLSRFWILQIKLCGQFSHQIIISLGQGVKADFGLWSSGQDQNQWSSFLTPVAGVSTYRMYGSDTPLHAQSTHKPASTACTLASSLGVVNNSHPPNPAVSPPMGASVLLVA